MTPGLNVCVITNIVHYWLNLIVQETEEKKCFINQPNDYFSLSLVPKMKYC